MQHSDERWIEALEADAEAKAKAASAGGEPAHLYQVLSEIEWMLMYDATRDYLDDALATTDKNSMIDGMPYAYAQRLHAALTVAAAAYRKFLHAAVESDNWPRFEELVFRYGLISESYNSLFPELQGAQHACMDIFCFLEMVDDERWDIERGLLPYSAEVIEQTPPDRLGFGFDGPYDKTPPPPRLPKEAAVAEKAPALVAPPPEPASNPPDPPAGPSWMSEAERTGREPDRSQRWGKVR